MSKIIVSTIFWWLFLFAFFSARMSVVCRGETLAQRDALVQFYNATNDPLRPWREKCATGGWKTLLSGPPPATFCNSPNSSYSTFYGVDCSAPNGSITRLSLASCNLRNPPTVSSSTASLPASLSVLEDLERLHLNSNDLEGTLPPEWSMLRTLRSLSLSSNRIEGSLPPQWSALQNLESLEVSYNQLVGALPDSWSQLGNLLEFRCEVNKLEGSLPPTWSNLSKLEWLEARNNRLTGTLPKEFVALQSLTKLSLSFNQLTGSLPAEWSAMPSLEQLGVVANQIVGTLPAAWANLSRLQWLEVGMNALNGTLPPEYSALSLVERFYVNDNDLSGTLPWEYAALTSLEYFNAAHNHLTGSLPVQWSTLPNVLQISLSNNALNGTIPEQWSNLTTLQQVSLHANDLSGTVPKTWPEAMRNIYRYSPCSSVICTGTIGVDAVCNETAVELKNCVSITLWYNCLEHSSQTVPPINESNNWNWGDSALFYWGPQRCQPTTTKAVRESPSLSLSFDASETKMVPSWTASLATSATLGSTLTRSHTLSHRELPTATHEAPIPAPQPSLVNNNVTRSLSLSSDDDDLDRDQNDDDPPRALAAVISPVASLLALFGVDPGGQGAQVALTVFACRSQKQRRSSSEPSSLSERLEDWLSTLSISPFFPLGLLWGTLGNVLLGGGLLLLHTMAVLVWHRWRLLRGADKSVTASETTNAAPLVEDVQVASGRSSSGCGWEAAAAEGLRFPSLSVAVLEWLLPGIALCGAAVVANTDGEQGAGAQAVGWLCLVACVGCIAGWYVVARYAAGRCTIGPPVAFTSPPLFFPTMYELLAQRMSWEPTSFAQRFGTFLVAVRSTGLWWWRWVSVALLTVVAALTGASASHPDACIAALSISTALLLVSALCIALVQPYALPSENALNPLKLLILAVTCLVLLAKHQQDEPDDDASWGEDALLALGASQLSVTLLRGLVKGYLRVAVCGISPAPAAPAASAPPPATSSAAVPCTTTTTTNSNDMTALASSVGSPHPHIKQEDPPRRNAVVLPTQEKEESLISTGSCDDEPTARVQEVEGEREMRLFQLGNHQEDDLFPRVQREDVTDAATSFISAPPQTSGVLLPTTTWISYERDEDVIL